MMNHPSPAFGLDEVTVQKIHQVLESNQNVEKAIIYGSRAKGNFKNGSDIDLTLVGPELDGLELLSIAEQLDDLMLPYQFDLSVFHLIHSADLLEHIQRAGKTFFVKRFRQKI